jgi:hypothetical protein
MRTPRSLDESSKLRPSTSAKRALMHQTPDFLLRTMKTPTKASGVALLHRSSTRSQATITHRRGLSLFLQFSSPPRLGHSNSNSNSPSQPGGTAGGGTPPQAYTSHVRNHHSLGSDNELSAASNTPTSEFGLALERVRMAFSLANSSGVPGANAQASTGPELKEIAVEVGKASFLLDMYIRSY